MAYHFSAMRVDEEVPSFSTLIFLDCDFPRHYPRKQTRRKVYLAQDKLSFLSLIDYLNRLLFSIGTYGFGLGSRLLFLEGYPFP